MTVSEGAALVCSSGMNKLGSLVDLSAKGGFRGNKPGSPSNGGLKHTLSGGGGAGAGGSGLSHFNSGVGSVLSAVDARGRVAAGGGRFLMRETPRRVLRFSACVLRKSVVGVSNLLRRILSLPCSVSIWLHITTTGEFTRTNLFASEADLAG